MTEDYQGPTPPPELFKQWEDDILNERDNVDYVLDCAWRDGFRAGADQELKACCEWVEREIGHGREWGAELRASRRPKPPSLAEEALDAMRSMQIEPCRINGITVNAELISKYNTICRALERLQELEGGND